MELNRAYRSRGVVFLGINANAHETETAIREQARTHGLDFPVLKDPENLVADLALIERTPEVVVLDGRARIRYRGAIDDQYGQESRKAEASHHYLKEALDAILAGRKVEVAATPALGCLLDRVEAGQAAAARPPGFALLRQAFARSVTSLRKRR